MAWVADAEAIGALQVRGWRTAYAGLLPPAVLEGLDPAEVAEQWAQSVRRPPSGRHRVLVALDRAAVVGFAALAPSEDPDADPVRDAELTVLVVDPGHLGEGHGSRLLAAAADTARADRFDRLSTWLLAGDDGLRRFLESTGWAPDGAHREMTLDDHSAGTRQVRLHTALVDA
jgi:GNAT superfamily N-acetyltransferase